jgi:hypothetical protein
MQTTFLLFIKPLSIGFYFPIKNEFILTRYILVLCIKHNMFTYLKLKIQYNIVMLFYVFDIIIKLIHTYSLNNKTV